MDEMTASTRSETAMQRPTTTAEWQAYLRWWVLKTGVAKVQRLAGVRSRKTIYGWLRTESPAMPRPKVREKLDRLMGLSE